MKFINVLLLISFLLCLPCIAWGRNEENVIGGKQGTVELETDPDETTAGPVVDQENTDLPPYYCETQSQCLEHQRCDMEKYRCVDCSEEVGGNAIEDECGVCGGDGSSCADCNGQAYGEASIDDCDQCTGGTTGKVANEDKDDCDVCFGENRDKDDCGVCFGENRNKDCNGECYGDAKLDACEVCNGDSSTCCGTGPSQLCSDHGACDSRAHGCVCDFGWTGARCSIKQFYCTDATGTTSIVDCGEHGYCSEELKGQCVCEPGFTGSQCSFKSCSGNGMYDPRIKECMCAAGFGGNECERCETPGENRFKQEMHMFQSFFGSLLEEMGEGKNAPSDLSISLGVDKLKRDIEFKGEMAYLCIPPRMFSQRHVDELVDMITRNMKRDVVVDHRYMADYLLIPVEKQLVPVYLQGMNDLVRDADGLPVLPNSTHNGVFYDCGCKAWDAEILELMEEGGDEDYRWPGSPAPNVMHGRSKFIRSLPAHKVREHQLKAVINETEAVDLVGECLDSWGSEVNEQTATKDEIGQAIQDGKSRREFEGDLLIGLLLSVSAFTVIVFGFSVLGIYSIALVTKSFES